MKIAIYGSRHQSRYLNEIVALINALRSHGVETVMARKLYDYLCESLQSAPAGVGEVVDDGADARFDADMAMSIGGDGTFLRTAQWVGRKEIPVLGINTGHLGYLADHRMDACQEWMRPLLEGCYEVESRTMIETELEGEGVTTPPGWWPYALNEAAVLKKDTASMIDIEAYINGTYLAHYRADGLIMATPTGSTGYNLSVGGPILDPSTRVWVLSPIAAHSLSMRPLVVDNSACFSLSTLSRARSYRLSLDGRSMSLPVGSTVYMRRAPFVTRVVMHPGHNFADTLRDKLHWGA